MPRLKNKLTGVVVNVDEETAQRISASYAPIVDPKPRNTKPE